MNILVYLVPLALGLGLFFLVLFLWASGKGQFDDLITPAHRVLLEDENQPNAALKNSKGNPKE